MDQNTLSEKDIATGHRLIIELMRSNVDVKAAFWALTDEDKRWHLYISSKSFQPNQSPENQAQVDTIARSVFADSMLSSQVKLIPPSNPISVAAVIARERHPANFEPLFAGKKLGPLKITGAYVYPRVRWFQGFGEIKQQFPSAEAFAVPILSKDADNPAIQLQTGQINADAFEGRAAGTVYFRGTQEKITDVLSELLFIHRPEGWSADISYPASDFALLSALKTDQKPFAHELNIVQTVMATGMYCMRLLGNPTPIRKIPHTIPAAGPGEEPTAIDWEYVRLVMEAGGKVDVRPYMPPTS